MNFILSVLLVLSAVTIHPTLCTVNQLLYSLIHGSLCINKEFVETYPEMDSEVGCANHCNRNQRCQAFSLADGPCQLFVFDKCSKSVRDCSCSRRGQVFVKQQPGLLAGALCPSGYGMDLCGVKYRLYSGIGTWQPSRQKCESESGLVIMADVTSTEELSHVQTILSNYSPGQQFWLGGYQTAGSPEPAGGWYWVGCNTTVDAALWRSGEPSNGDNVENAIIKSVNQGMNDVSETHSTSVAFCECVSPFD